MPEMNREPCCIGIMNDLIDFAKRTPKLSGSISHTLLDGRTIEIRIRLPKDEGANERRNDNINIHRD